MNHAPKIALSIIGGIGIGYLLQQLYVSLVKGMQPLYYIPVAIFVIAFIFWSYFKFSFKVYHILIFVITAYFSQNYLIEKANEEIIKEYKSRGGEPRRYFQFK